MVKKILSAFIIFSFLLFFLPAKVSAEVSIFTDKGTNKKILNCKEKKFGESQLEYNKELIMVGFKDNVSDQEKIDLFTKLDIKYYTLNNALGLTCVSLPEGICNYDDITGKLKDAAIVSNVIPDFFLPNKDNFLLTDKFIVLFNKSDMEVCQ